MLRCAAWAPRWSSLAAGARTPRSWSTVSATLRTAWSSTISCCSTRATSVGRWSEASPSAFCGRGAGAGRSPRRPTRTPPWRGPISSSSSCGSGARRRATSTRRSRSATAAWVRRPTGAGGLAKALRTVPIVLGLAEEMAARVQSGCLAGRLHQSGGDRDAGAARRGPPRRGPVQRRHLGPATHRALSRRRSRRRGRRARGSEPSHVDQVGPRRRAGRGVDRARRPVRALRSRARARERHPDRRAPPAARAALVLRALLLPARRRGGPAVGARATGPAPTSWPSWRPSCSRSTATLPWRRSRQPSRTAAAPTTRWPPCA